MELSRNELTKILESVDCGIFTIDTGYRITYWNPAAEKITGRPASRMIGRKCSEVLCGDCLNILEGDNEGSCKLFERGWGENTECVVLRPDGSSVRVLKNSSVFYGSDGSPTGAVESLTDISTLKFPVKKKGTAEARQKDTSPVPGMIGTSEPMRQVYRLIRFAADSESTVLISGESGTGKELVAKAIHNLSRRGSGPFVPVNCSALPEGLLESELNNLTQLSQYGLAIKLGDIKCTWLSIIIFSLCFPAGNQPLGT